MQLVVRALRGPSWLAWLSLLFAAQIGTADAIAGGESDDLQDRAAVHAPVCPRPLPAVSGAAPGRGIDHHEESPPSPVVLSAPAAQLRGTPTRSVGESLPGVPRATTSVRRCLRAPPFSCSLQVTSAYH